MANPLSLDNILSHMADALPTHTKDDTTSDISDSYQAIALFTHACMKALDFRLLGFAEGQNIEAELAKLSPRLSPKWIAGFGSHSFVYAHSQSSMQFVIKIDRLGGKAEIRGLGVGHERICRLEITAKDYVSPSALPLRITMTQAGEEDRSDLVAKLKELFISPSRITDLATDLKSNIIQKLLPNLSKEGYEESASDTASTARDETRENRDRLEDARRNPNDGYPRPGLLPEPARPRPFDDPLMEQRPRRNLPEPIPGFDDELDILRPAGRQPRASPFGPFGNIGHDDLNPPGLGPHDPLRGSFTGGGVRPAGGFGGMHPTFDDPLFGGRGGDGGYDPQAPPGARYDPVGPGFNPPRPGGPGTGRGNFPGGGFGGYGGGIL